MSTERTQAQFTLTQRDAMMKAAKQGALQARREAIDQFWSALGRRLSIAWRALRPSRPQARLASRSCAYRR